MQKGRSTIGNERNNYDGSETSEGRSTIGIMLFKCDGPMPIPFLILIAVGRIK